jgi:hypothetical protein
MVVLCASPLRAQLLDGMPQGRKYKIFIPYSASIDNSSHKVSVSPFISYKYEVTNWLSISPLIQYYHANEEVSTQVWFSWDYKKKYYFSARSMFDIRSRKYREELTTTLWLPKRITIDATWTNLYNGRAFLDGDRLQILGGAALGKRIVFNVGYSVRANPGLIANLRFVATPRRFLQVKYDGGLKMLGGSIVVSFD